MTVGRAQFEGWWEQEQGCNVKGPEGERVNVEV